MLESKIDTEQLVTALKESKIEIIELGLQNKIYNISIIAPASPVNQTRLNLMYQGPCDIGEQATFIEAIEKLLQKKNVMREGEYSIIVELYPLEIMRSASKPWKDINEEIIKSAIPIQQIDQLERNSLNAEWQKRKLEADKTGLLREIPHGEGSLQKLNEQEEKFIKGTRKSKEIGFQNLNNKRRKRNNQPNVTSHENLKSFSEKEENKSKNKPIY